MKTINENETFRKRSPEWNFLKTLFSRVCVDKTKTERKQKENKKKTLRSRHNVQSTPRNMKDLFKMADRRFPFLSFNTYASSMRSRASYRFQIDSS